MVKKLTHGKNSENMANELPEGWTAKKSKFGKTMYFHAATNTRQREHPGARSENAEKQVSKASVENRFRARARSCPTARKRVEKLTSVDSGIGSSPDVPDRQNLVGCQDIPFWMNSDLSCKKIFFKTVFIKF